MPMVENRVESLNLRGHAAWQVPCGENCSELSAGIRPAAYARCRGGDYLWMSRARLYAFRAQGEFIRPDMLGGRPMYRREDLDSYVAKLTPKKR
jgi:hypothetical protein